MQQTIAQKPAGSVVRSASISVNISSSDFEYALEILQIYNAAKDGRTSFGAFI
jgi:hypothetical protein